MFHSLLKGTGTVPAFIKGTTYIPREGGIRFTAFSNEPRESDRARFVLTNDHCTSILAHHEDRERMEPLTETRF